MSFTRPTTKAVLLALTALLLAFATLLPLGAAGARADGGGAAPDDPPAKTNSNSGGSTVGKRSKKRRSRSPVLAGFTLSSATLSGDSQMKLRYRVKASAKRVRVRGVVRTKGGKYIKTLELGVHRTNVLVTTALTAREVGVERAGGYKLRLSARDSKGRGAKRAKRVPAWRIFSYSDHRFPLTGNFSFGSGGAGFGAGRPGHIHQGQDIIADSGTPIVAPYSGTISWVDYQAGGAGYYVVEHADDGRDYVFMHLLKGSTLVKQGDRVSTGQRLGLVGATGQASGPHLHFEVWVDGPWQFGGHPVDPLPLLKSWYASGAGGAVRTSAVASVAGPLD